MRRAFAREGIDAVAMALATAPEGHGALLRRYGATVAADAVIAGPLHLVNAGGSFANLTIGAGAVLGPEVHLDLTAPVTIGAGAVLEPRSALVTGARAAGLRPGTFPERPVVVGPGARVGTGATIVGAAIGAGAVIDPHALVTAGVAAGAHVTWHEAADLAVVRSR